MAVGPQYQHSLLILRCVQSSYMAINSNYKLQPCYEALCQKHRVVRRECWMQVTDLDYGAGEVEISAIANGLKPQTSSRKS
jgi:hypothetical protein